MIPITATEAILRRIFHVLASPVGVQALGGNGITLSSHVNGVVDTQLISPWWRYLLAE